MYIIIHTCVYINVYIKNESFDYSKFGLVSYNDVVKNKYSEKEVLKMMIRLYEIKSR